MMTNWNGWIWTGMKHGFAGSKIWKNGIAAQQDQVPAIRIKDVCMRFKINEINAGSPEGISAGHPETAE